MGFLEMEGTAAVSANLSDVTLSVFGIHQATMIILTLIFRTLGTGSTFSV